MDKLLHFFTAYSIVLTFTTFDRWIIGLIIASVLSVSKEIYDYYGHGDFDVKDLLADALGILFALIVYRVSFM